MSDDEYGSDQEFEEDGDGDGEDDGPEVDTVALAAMVEGMDDDSVLTLFASANEALKVLEAKNSEDLAPLSADNLALTKQLIDFMEASEIDAIGIDTASSSSGPGSGLGPSPDPDDGGEDVEAAETAEATEAAPRQGWYLRLSYSVCTAEKPCSKLFSSVIADLTPVTFMAKVAELEEDRAARLESWRKARRAEAVKTLRAKKRAWVKDQAVQVKPYKRTKTRTSAAKAMADTAEALGDAAASHLDTILKAGQRRSAITEGTGPGTGLGTGPGTGIGLVPVPDPTNEDQIEALVGDPPGYEAVSYRNGKGGSKFPVRGKLPLTGALTRRQLLGEVLYCMIVERSKGRKAKLTVTGAKGRPRALVEGDVVPPEVRTNCVALRGVREAKARVGRRSRRERAMQRAVMAACEPRVRAYLEVLSPEDTKVKRVMDTDGVKRTLIFKTVEEPKLRKPINMWDVSTLVEAAVEAVLAPADLDAVMEDAGRLLNDRVTSALLTAMLKKTTELEAERTVKVTRVKINRTGAVPIAAAVGAGVGAGAGVDVGELL